MGHRLESRFITGAASCHLNNTGYAAFVTDYIDHLAHQVSPTGAIIAAIRRRKYNLFIALPP